MKQNRDVRLTARLAFGITVGAVGVLLPFKSGPAQAGDDAGVREFIASQAPVARSVSAPPVAARPALASLPYAESLARYHFAPPRGPRASARVQREPTPRQPKAAFVKLAEPQPASKPKTTKNGGALSSSDPAVAVLSDPTLQPGDIVVLRNGPRVFVSPGKFEDVGHSKLLTKQVRKAVVAITQPSLAPSKEAASRVASATPALSNALQTAAADVRVVYPGLSAR